MSQPDPDRSFSERLRFWRSPEGQPESARPILLGIATLAAVLYAWNIRSSGYALYYSVAAKSMSVSWKALLYGAFDPGATITIDKLAGAFVPQALCARIFGYHAWSLTLPQVIEGVISVFAMYRIGRRWHGASVGLGAAALFTLTPVVASMFGHPMEDGALTMCLVLAADAFQLAYMSGRLGPLIWSGVWIGIGFQTKMMQAWIPVPAMALTYLLVAPIELRARVRHVAIAGVAMLAVSVSWLTVYQLTPAKDRPYINGSTNNNAFSMAFGYNGFSRFGFDVPGAVVSNFTTGGKKNRAPADDANSQSGQRGNNGRSQGSGNGFGGAFDGMPGGGFAAPPGGGPPGGPNHGPDWTKLISMRYAPQIGWLYPLALLSLLLGISRYGRADRSEPIRGGYVFWGLWLATFAVVFSIMEIPHTAYMSSLAPALAALSAAGVATAIESFQQRDHLRLFLPIIVMAQAAWTYYLSGMFPDFLPMLHWAIPSAAAIAVVVMVWDSLRPIQHRGIIIRGLVAAAFAMIAAPAVWTGSVLNPKYAGSAFDASAGPSSRFGPGGFGQGRMPDGFDGFGGGQRSNGSSGSNGSSKGGLQGWIDKLFPGSDDKSNNGRSDQGSSSGRSGSGRSGGSGDSGFGGFGTGIGFDGFGNSGSGNSRPGGGGPGFGGPTGSAKLSPSQQRINDFLVKNRGKAKYVAAASSWNTAGTYITATGQPYLPMGGFSGTVPQPTLQTVQRMVANGELKYFLVGGMGFGGMGFGGGQTEASRINSWVQANCSTVSEFSMNSSSGSRQSGNRRSDDKSDDDSDDKSDDGWGFGLGNWGSGGSNDRSSNRGSGGDNGQGSNWGSGLAERLGSSLANGFGSGMPGMSETVYSCTKGSSGGSGGNGRSWWDR